MPDAFRGTMGLHLSALAMLGTSESVARITQRLSRGNPNMAEDNTPYKEIPLTQGKVALVDVADYEAVSKFEWQAHRGRRGNWYARRSPQKGENNGNSVSLHRFLMGFPLGEVDHRNRDGLDNRRKNLRSATRSCNAHNSGPRKGNKCGFKGVSYLNRPTLTRRWIAQIRKEETKYFLGYFATAEEAARAHDKKALELYGEFAYLNFPEEANQ